MIDIAIQLESETICPGDLLSGSLIWQSPEGDQVPRKAIASLGWHTEGWGNTDQRTVQKRSFHVDPLHSSSQPIPFAFQIPDNAPITYDGALIRIIWELHVCLYWTVLSLPLRKGPQEQTCRIYVVPRHSE